MSGCRTRWLRRRLRVARIPDVGPRAPGVGAPVTVVAAQSPATGDSPATDDSPATGDSPGTAPKGMAAAGSHAPAADQSASLDLDAESREGEPPNGPAPVTGRRRLSGRRRRSQCTAPSPRCDARGSGRSLALACLAREPGNAEHAPGRCLDFERLESASRAGAISGHLLPLAEGQAGIEFQRLPSALSGLGDDAAKTRHTFLVRPSPRSIWAIRTFCLALSQLPSSSRPAVGSIRRKVCSASANCFRSMRFWMTSGAAPLIFEECPR